jgi:hypothetical protein
VLEEHEGRHLQRLVQGAGDGGEVGPRPGASRQLSDKEQVGVDARAVHRARIGEEVVLGGEFSVGELEEEMERSESIEAGALLGREGAVGVPVLAKLLHRGDAHGALGLVAEGGEEPASGGGQRLGAEGGERGDEIGAEITHGFARSNQVRPLAVRRVALVWAGRLVGDSALNPSGSHQRFKVGFAKVLPITDVGCLLQGIACAGFLGGSEHLGYLLGSLRGDLRGG